MTSSTKQAAFIHVRSVSLTPAPCLINQLMCVAILCVLRSYVRDDDILLHFTCACQ